MTRSVLLEAQLARYEPIDARESGHRERMRSLLATSRDPFARDGYSPGHFTASAFVLSPEADHILLILHHKLGLWLQPGGHVDPDDHDLEAAARREVLEEVGLDRLGLAHAGIFDVDVHGIPARGAEPAHEHFDVRYLLQAASRSFTLSDEAREVRWVALDAITDAGSDDSVLRAVRKLRRVVG